MNQHSIDFVEHEWESEVSPTLSMREVAVDDDWGCEEAFIPAPDETNDDFEAWARQALSASGFGAVAADFV